MKISFECFVHGFKTIEKSVNNNQFQLIAKVPAPIDQAGKPLGKDNFYIVFVKDKSIEQNLYERINGYVKANPNQVFRIECFLNGRKYDKDGKEFIANNMALNLITAI